MRAPDHAGGASRRRGPAHPEGGDLARGRPAARADAQHAQIIAQSHQRCEALGVSRIEKPDFALIGRGELQGLRERHRRLLDQALPVMSMLHEQIIATESMVVLTDSAGIVLHSIGDDEFLARAASVALAPGASWAERAKGTNAVGTVLMQEAPVLVHADEHYLHANAFLTCSAAPIHDPRGNLLGVLDVSGDCRSYHPHTMALVKMSARMIENRWLGADLRTPMCLHFHRRAEGLGSLMDGIVSVDTDGRVVGANHAALEQLGLSSAQLRTQSLGSVFGLSLAELVDRFRSPLATPLCVQTPAGGEFHLVARFNWPAWSSRADAVTVPVSSIGQAAPAPATAPERGNLQALRTGDATFDALVDRLHRVATRDIPVHLVGESGTGRRTQAAALHADRGRGRFVVWHGGEAQPPPTAPDDSLFVAEADQLSPPQQAALRQRLLQQPTLRTVCASRRPLSELRAEGAFEADLFYRLTGLVVCLPPLRERQDLPVLVARIVALEAPGRSLRAGPGFLDRLQRCAWPGNLRQLSGVLRTAVALADGAELSADVLAGAGLDDGDRPVAQSPAATPPAPVTVEAAATSGRLQDVQRATMQQALAAAGGNMTEAARRLGISRNTLYRKLRWVASAD